MISLHVTVYNLDDGKGDRFKVCVINSDTGAPTDVTDHYEMVAAKTDDGRDGFFVVKREDS